jgi:hypothetical protein
MRAPHEAVADQPDIQLFFHRSHIRTNHKSPITNHQSPINPQSSIPNPQ